MSEATFAEKLKRLREAAGLSQSQLAERAGMHHFGVAKLEQGLREPTWATVQALAAALGVNCLAFAQGSDPGPEPDPATEPRPGRPRKGEPAAEPPAGGRGRKGKGKQK